MANELAYRHDQIGVNLYAVLRKHAPDNRHWNADSGDWESLTVANWEDYALAMSETPANSFFYLRTLPAIAGNMEAGWFWVDIFERQGADPSHRDFHVASIYGYWTGTEFLVREPSTGDSYAVVTNSDYGNAQLVRADDPTEKLRVTDGRAAANVERAAGRPIGDVGPGNTAHLLQEADEGATAVARRGATEGRTISDLPTAAQAYTYFVDGSRPDPFKATGYATPSDIVKERAAIISHGDGAWATSTATLAKQNEILTAIGQVKAPGGSDAVAITVESDGDKVQNAVVTLHDGPQIVSQEKTNADGLANLTANPGTYRLSVWKLGYLAHSENIEVESGGYEGTVEVTRIEVSPSEAGFVTGHWTAFGVNGQAEAGVVHYLEVRAGAGTDGLSLPTTIRQAVSNTGGVVQFPGIPHGATVWAGRGMSSLRGPYTAPSEGSTWAMDEVVGTP